MNLARENQTGHASEEEMLRNVLILNFLQKKKRVMNIQNRMRFAQAAAIAELGINEGHSSMGIL
jgi:hypothetical protein